MRFREPEATKLNLLRLLPVGLLVVAIAFAIHSVYRYATGVEEDLLWVALGVVAVIYFTVRSWFSARHVFVFGDDAAGSDEE